MEALVNFRKTVMIFIKIFTIFAITSTFIGMWQSVYREAAIFRTKGNFLIIGSYLLVFVVISRLYSSYKIGISRMHELIFSLTLSSLITNVIIYIELCLVARKMLQFYAMLGLTIIQFFCICICVYGMTVTYFRLFQPKHVLAVFDVENKNDIIKKMSQIKERFSLDKGITIDRDLSEIKAQIDIHDLILICDFDQNLRATILKYCYEKGKRILYLPSTRDVLINNCESIQIYDTSMLICRGEGLTFEQRTVKRFADIAISSVSLLLFSPIMLISALFIKLCDWGPIIFKQKRVTTNGRIFEIYKFRSMYEHTELKKTMVNDDRITPIGKIMRPFRIDELPQLINVLKGDMSIVGPRPEMVENVVEYTNLLPEFGIRHKVKAGLTGYAQIYGKYNTTPANKLNMDLHYIENYSFREDLKLLFMTVKILFIKESTEGFSEKNSKIEDIEGDLK